MNVEQEEFVHHRSHSPSEERVGELTDPLSSFCSGVASTCQALFTMHTSVRGFRQARTNCEVRNRNQDDLDMPDPYLMTQVGG